MRSRFHRIGILAASAALCIARTAAATGDPTPIVQIIEIAVPDLHLELHRDGHLPLVVAWPMHAGVDWRVLPRNLALTIFIEPALVPSREAARFALGTRVGLGFGARYNDIAPGLLFEAGGLVATDGAGGFVGAGLGGLYVHEKGTVLAVTYRYVMTTQTPRHDFGLDLVTLPF